MTAQMTSQMTSPATARSAPDGADGTTEPLPLRFLDDDAPVAPVATPFPSAGSPNVVTGLAAHAELADLLLDRPVPVAPWNRAGAARPVGDRVRHLRLVTTAPAPVAPVAPVARRGRVRTLLAGLGLAGLVSLASVGVLAFLGADAAASTPASSTGATLSVVAPVATPSTVAESAAPRWVVVQPGDSLWTLARRLQPKGDLRRLVDRLAERVGGAAITAGQRVDVSGLVD